MTYKLLYLRNTRCKEASGLVGPCPTRPKIGGLVGPCPTRPVGPCPTRRVAAGGLPPVCVNNRYPPLNPAYTPTGPHPERPKTGTRAHKCLPRRIILSGTMVVLRSPSGCAKITDTPASQGVYLTRPTDARNVSRGSRNTTGKRCSHLPVKGRAWGATPPPHDPSWPDPAAEPEGVRPKSGVSPARSTVEHGRS